jgi:hypothetical protein
MAGILVDRQAIPLCTSSLSSLSTTDCGRLEFRPQRRIRADIELRIDESKPTAIMKNFFESAGAFTYLKTFYRHAKKVVLFIKG